MISNSLLLTGRELTVLQHSFIIGIFGAFFATIIAAILTLLWHQPSYQRLGILRYSVIIPLLIPPFLHALTWDNLLIVLSQTGFLNSGTYVASLRSMTGIIFLLSLAYFPLPLLIFLNTLRSLPRSSIDSGLLATTPGSTLWHIARPLLTPAGLTGFLLTFIFCFTTFDIPEYFSVPVFVTEVFAAFSARYDTVRALLLSGIPVVLTMVVMTILIKRFVGRRVFFSPIISPAYIFRIKSPIINGVLWGFYMLVIIASVIVPLTSFIIQGSFFSASVRHALFSSREIIFNTVWVSVWGGFVSVILSLMVYRWIYRWTAGRIILLSLFAMPAITFGIVCIMVFNQPFLSFFYASTSMLILAYALRFVPIVCETLYTYYLSINPQLFDAAKLHSKGGLSYIKTFWWPLTKPALILGWMIGFWLIVSELPITLLIQPAGFQTVTSRIYIFLHYGSQEFTNALTLSLVVLSLLPILVVFAAFAYEDSKT